jgi:hypothetical protein
LLVILCSDLEFFALRGSPYASDPNRVPEFIFPRVNFLNLQQFMKIPSLKYCEKCDNCLYVSSGSKNFATVPGRSRLPFQSKWSGSGTLETSVLVFAANGISQGTVPVVFRLCLGKP